MDLLKKANIAYSSLNSVSDVSKHQFLKTSYAKIGNQNIELAALPVSTESGSPINVPDLGEHNKKLKEEFSQEKTTGKEQIFKYKKLLIS